MINLICNNAWDITTGIFSIVGVLLTLLLSILIPIYNYNKNKVNNKTLNATFNAVQQYYQIPKLKDNGAIMFSCNVICLNKTNKDISIVNAEIINKDKIVNLFSGSKTSSFTVKAKATYSHAFRLIIIPTIFKITNDMKLRLYTLDKILDYDICFPHDEVSCLKNIK